MMKSSDTAWIPLAIAVAASATLPISHAQAGDHGDWYIAPALNYISADNDRDADNDFGFQIGLGKQLSESWNLEGNVQADTLDIDSSSGGGRFRQRGLALDGLYFFDRAPAVAPYGLIGAGVLNTRVPGEEGTHPMANAGLGLLWHVAGDRAAVRTELRYRWDGDDESVASEDSFGDWIVSIGMSIPLGGGAALAAAAAPVAAVAAAAAPAPAAHVLDSDGDGVNDDVDACPNSPAGARVDARGCAPDSDGDGVADGADRCPGTAAGVRVDAQGCAPDSDGDGVADDQDRCPASAAGVKVDVHGCEIKEVIELPGVNFETGSARLLATSTAILDDAAATLLKHTGLKAEVAGHTDSRGTRALNVRLSQQRAEAVMNYLVAKGVAATRLTAHGYGPDRPVADNATDAGRAANRRVELRIAE